MAQIDWHQKGHDYAYSWTPDSKLPEFPDDTAKQHFTDGYKTGWWERGNDDARSGRRWKNFRTDAPPVTTWTVIPTKLVTGTTKICC